MWWRKVSCNGSRWQIEFRHGTLKGFFKFNAANAMRLWDLSFYTRHPKQQFRPLPPTGGFLTGGRHALEESICMRGSLADNADSWGLLGRLLGTWNTHTHRHTHTHTCAQIQCFLHSLGLTSSCNSMQWALMSLYHSCCFGGTRAGALKTRAKSQNLTWLNYIYVFPLQPKREKSNWRCHCIWNPEKHTPTHKFNIQHLLHSVDFASSCNCMQWSISTWFIVI